MPSRSRQSTRSPGAKRQPFPPIGLAVGWRYVAARQDGGTAQPRHVCRQHRREMPARRRKLPMSALALQPHQHPGFIAMGRPVVAAWFGDGSAGKVLDAGRSRRMGGEFLAGAADTARARAAGGFTMPLRAATSPCPLNRHATTPSPLPRSVVRFLFTSWTALPLPPCKCLKPQPGGHPGKPVPGLCPWACRRRTSVRQPSMHP